VFKKDYKPLLVFLEVLTVLRIAYVYMSSSTNDPNHPPHGFAWLRRDTHQRWLDARLISKSQRGAQLLSWIGFSGRRPIDDPNGNQAGAHPPADHAPIPGHAERALWAPHFANAIAALPEMPPADKAGTKIAALDTKRVALIAEATGQAIASQTGYHAVNHDRLTHLHLRLDKLGRYALLAAFAASVFYLVVHGFDAGLAPAKESMLYYLDKYAAKVAAFAGGVGPAVAAAAAGVRYHGDFERFASRSKDTARQLKALKHRADLLQKRAEATTPTSPAPPLLEPLLSLLLDTPAVLDEDLLDWRFPYSARPITFG